jgi:uncharacterized damage-inducible protein DinB
MIKIPKPLEGEYPSYAPHYINLVPDDGQIIVHLRDAMQTTLALMSSLSPEKQGTPCAEGEWTAKEILSHIMDSERIFCYRALRFARNDATALNGFDHDTYVLHSCANEQELSALLEEYTAIRQASITLFKNLDEQALICQGMVNNNSFSVRALAYMIAGHEQHHLNSIREHYAT